MISWLWQHAAWFSVVLAAVPYLSKLSMFARLFTILGPVGEVLQTFLEGAAQAISYLAIGLLKSVWFLLFHPIAWPGWALVGLLGHLGAFHYIRVHVGLERPAIVHQVDKPEHKGILQRYTTTPTKRPRAATSDARSDFKFDSH